MNNIKYTFIVVALAVLAAVVPFSQVSQAEVVVPISTEVESKVGTVGAGAGVDLISETTVIVDENGETIVPINQQPEVSITANEFPVFDWVFKGLIVMFLVWLLIIRLKKTERKPYDEEILKSLEDKDGAEIFNKTFDDPSDAVDEFNLEVFGIDADKYNIKINVAINIKKKDDEESTDKQ